MHLFSSRISFIYSAISNPRVCVKFFFCFVLFSFLFCSCSSRSDMCRFVHSFDAHRGAICFCFVIAIVYFVTYKSGQFFLRLCFECFYFEFFSWDTIRLCAIFFFSHHSICTLIHIVHCCYSVQRFVMLFDQLLCSPNWQ